MVAWLRGKFWWWPLTAEQRLQVIKSVEDMKHGRVVPFDGW